MIPFDDEYSAGKRGKKPRSSKDGSWGLVLVFIVASSCAVYTRHRSLIFTATASATDPTPRVVLLEEEVKEPAVTVTHDGITYRTDAAAQAQAEATFNPTLHNMYKNLPPLQQMTEYLEKGGWQYNDAVYEYAAHHPAAEVVSWDRPRAVVFKSFLTPEEVGHVIAVAKDNLERSHVLSAQENDEVDDVRTSYGAWPPQDSVLESINERIHRLTGIPYSFGEDLYVLNYKLGQKYNAHNDNCVDMINSHIPKLLDNACMGFLKRAGGPDCGAGGGGDSCGDRIATLILHLASPSRGGRTTFPNAETPASSGEEEGEEGNSNGAATAGSGDDDDPWYCKGDKALGVNPNPGDATLFYNYKPANGPGVGSYSNQTANPRALPVSEALHSGCPVLEGEKWIATRWIRSAKFT